MILEDPRIKNTERFLQLISYRLSGRNDLRHVEYEVTISSKNAVTMHPLIYVYPNRYNRKESDKVDIVSYILTMMVTARDFVPGKYIYKCSADNKKRKWIKL